MLMYLSRHPGQMFKAKELKEILKIDLDVNEIKIRLKKLQEAELLGRSWNSYAGLKDGTFYLLLQRYLEDEMEDLGLEPDPGLQERVDELLEEKQTMQGKLNNAEGRLAEAMLESDMRMRQQFKPSAYFWGMDDAPEIVIKEIYPRYYVQAPGVKREIDLRIDSEDGISLLVEVKKTEKTMGAQVIRDFAAKVALFAEQNPDQKVLAAFLSKGGFTSDALTLCLEQGMGTATKVRYLNRE